jgi:hypothetical protein
VIVGVRDALNTLSFRMQIICVRKYEVARLETVVAEVLTSSILVERLAMTTTEVELARLEMAIAEVLRATAEITAAGETMARELAADSAGWRSWRR